MSLVDVVAAFNIVCIKESGEKKTTFQTRCGLCGYSVMPSSLCNTPGTFSTFFRPSHQRMQLDALARRPGI
jgi:hypothetical protein